MILALEIEYYAKKVVYKRKLCYNLPREKRKMRLVMFCDLTDDQLDKIIDAHYNQWKQYNDNLVKEVSAKKFKTIYNSRRLPYGVALFDGLELVGFCILKLSDLPTLPELTPWISNLQIFKAQRRKNYGTILVEEAIKRLKSHGYKQVYVWTDQASLFLRKIGFKYYGTAVKGLSGEGDIYLKEF